ncbi:hypothetical protein SCODD09_00965 [Streptococcus constellatus]|nr:hypothetical protein SCODD09_00965 [Streptococcus constellatus]
MSIIELIFWSVLLVSIVITILTVFSLVKVSSQIAHTEEISHR